MAKHIQPDLFGEAIQADPLIGLSVVLPNSCKCGTTECVIAVGKGSHLASLHCRVCETHRGWVGRRTHDFLVETIKQFGRPVAPVAIRRERAIGFIHIGKIDQKSENPPTEEK